MNFMELDGDNVGKLRYRMTIKTHEMWLIVLFRKLGRSLPFKC